MNHTNKISIEDVYLKEGKHRIVIDFDSKVPSVYSYDDIHKFDPAEINAPSEEVSIYEDPGYTECNPISFDMMRDNKSDNSIKIDYDRTCSIYWYEYASKLLEVKEDDEYLYTFSAISRGIRKRHTKVLFLDKDKNLVDTVYINEVEEKDKVKWNNYQQIVKVPKNVEYMQFHILAKGNKKTEGYFEMKDYSVILYKNLISLDSMIIFEEYEGMKDFLSNKKIDAKITNINRIGTMKRTFKLYNPYNNRILINAKESPNALWLVNIDDFSSRGTLVLNGVTMGIITESSGEGKMTIVLREIYYMGLIFYIIGIISVVILNVKF
jgi:hypothetical protein